MSNWIVKRGTLERQVADTETLQRLARDKRLRPDDLVFHTATQEWLSATAVPELTDAFAEPFPETQAERAEAGPRETAAAAETAGLPASVAASPAVTNVWGTSSRILGVIGGATAIFGGVTLVGLKAASENSLIEAIAHGLGIYCIGKGVFMIAAVTNMKAAVDFIAHRIRQ